MSERADAIVECSRCEGEGRPPDSLTPPCEVRPTKEHAVLREMASASQDEDDMLPDTPDGLDRCPGCGMSREYREANPNAMHHRFHDLCPSCGSSLDRRELHSSGRPWCPDFWHERRGL